MLYELHITTDTIDNHAGWKLACKMAGIKPLLIELHGGGQRPMQMMSAAQIDSDSETLVRGWASEQANTLISRNFKIERVKLEVPLDKGIGLYPGAAYHEAHVKVLVKPEQSRKFVERAGAYGWVASRNLFYKEQAGYEKWYLTMRAYNVVAEAASDGFMDAWGEVRPLMPSVARLEMETVISDSNPSLDRGWA